MIVRSVWDQDGGRVHEAIVEGAWTALKGEDAPVPTWTSRWGPPVKMTYPANHVRQQRRRANGTVTPLSPRVYAEIRASGPCVYCGALAAAADHVLALSRGGRDVRENLVPACQRCNQQKKDRLLTEWDEERVARAAALSPIVAAELARLLN